MSNTGDGGRGSSRHNEAYESGFEDMPRRVPDLTKVTELVGYEPRVDLFEILSKVIEHHRAHTEYR